MARHPVSDEVGAALGAFVAGGTGPRHSVLTRVFVRAGYGAAAPYNSNSAAQQMNKEDRVRETIGAAVRDPGRSRELVEALLGEYRVAGLFDGDRPELVRTVQAAFARIDWELTDGGDLHSAGTAVVAAAQGRPAIEDQLARLRRATGDPALSLGTAKEMLKSTAKLVLEEFSVPYSSKTSFDELWFHARDRLGLHPKDVDVNAPGGKQVREILERLLGDRPDGQRRAQRRGHRPWTHAADRDVARDRAARRS